MTAWGYVAYPPAACPVCGLTGGFHGESPHRESRARIPAELTWRPGQAPVWQMERRLWQRGDPS